MAIRCALLSLLLAVSAVSAPAQVPVGVEFRVDGSTHATNPSVAADAAGNFVVVWRAGSADVDVQARRFSASGAPRGAQFMVSEPFTLAGTNEPTVAMAPDGEFVVVWEQTNGSAPNVEGHIFARRYDPEGQPLGTQFAVNWPGSSFRAGALAGFDAAKNIVIVWTGEDDWDNGVFAQRFDASNQRVGAEFRVNGNTQVQQLARGIDVAPDGRFVIAWQDWGNNPGVTVNARRYSANGTALGPEFIVDAIGGHPGSIRPNFSPDGTILFVFDRDDGSGSGIFLRRYTAAGLPLGPRFQVNTYTTGFQTAPWLAMDSDGNYVVQWQDAVGDGSGRGIKARAFSAADAPAGAEFVVNSYTTGDQSNWFTSPTVASGDSGEVVIVWDSANNTTGLPRHVYAQRLGRGLCPIGPPTLPPATAGTHFVQLFDQPAGVPPSTWSLDGALPDGLALDPGAGLLEGTPLEVGLFPITVTAVDATKWCAGSQSYTLAVSCPAISVAPPGIATGTAGAVYSQVFAQTGAVGAVTWALSGALPAGLAFNPSTGTLSGTPSQVGSYPISVRATDANGCFGTRSYVLVVNCQTISVGPPTLPMGKRGTPYQQQITQANGIGAVTWLASGKLPGGVSLHPTTGVLSGTPILVGHFGFSVTATDGNGCAGSRAYTIDVCGGPSFPCGR